MAKPKFGTHFSNVISGDTTHKIADYTLVKDDDYGVQFTSDIEGVAFTLPALSANPDGAIFKIMNTAEDGSNDLTINPDANDGINYKSSATDNKDLINTKSTSKKGDFVVITNDAGAGYWVVTSIRGIWAKEAA